jgi:hypothetical protein
MKIQIERELIEWIYEWSMEYKRFEWMSLQEFYTMNANNIEKHLLNKSWKWIPFQKAINIIYSDILDND